MGKELSPATFSSAVVAEFDVVVIGGGPAGSTVGARLAQLGHKVLVLEKEHHPRFHIGESLLPANLPLLEKLGVADAVKAIGMEKWGAEFVSPWHERKSQTFKFGDAWDKSMPFSYQVRRSEFDEILIRNATRLGAEVIEGCRVKKVDFSPGGAAATVHAQHDDGRIEQWQARYVVDASGRDTLLGKQLEVKRRNRMHNSSALYAHFTGVIRHAGQDEGNITIFWFEHGWFWLIPLADGCTSIGAVVWPYYLKSRCKPLKEFFADTFALCPALAERLAHATQLSQVEATGNFSYACEHTHGPNYLLIGDAFTFIDPVFSSGVMLAMQGGFVAADTVDTCLRHPARVASALAHFDSQVRLGPKEFSWFIYRVTNPAMRDMFMEPSNVWRVKEALLSMLAGDIFGKTPIWRSLAALKAIFYVASAWNFKRSWQAMQLRKVNIRVVEGLELAPNAAVINTDGIKRKPAPEPDENLTTGADRRAVHETVRLYLGFVLLGLVCLTVTLLAIVMHMVLPRALRKKAGRSLVAATLRGYLQLLVLSGACRFDLSELDSLRGGPPMIIAPNHPCLLDAIMILSRLPNAGCIMKADLVNSVLFGAGTRLAGYIRNTPLRRMVKLAVEDLRQGSQLLLFPEGTRTARFPVSAMQGTTGLIAKNAGVPVQTVFIETNSGFLGKGWSLQRTPKMPVTYRVRLGRRFDPPTHTADFAGELEHYFQVELARAELPDFPIKSA